MPSEETTNRIDQRLHSPGPKRLLALDGAGARNAVTFPILKAMESALQQQAENSELRLCDYFDVIGGTNTGAVIAAMLARGMRVGEAQEHFGALCPRLFSKQPLHKRLTSKYTAATAREALMETFGEEPLNSQRLQSALCIFTFRLDEAAPFDWKRGGKFRGDSRSRGTWARAAAGTLSFLITGTDSRGDDRVV